MSHATGKTALLNAEYMQGLSARTRRTQFISPQETEAGTEHIMGGNHKGRECRK